MRGHSVGWRPAVELRTARQCRGTEMGKTQGVPVLKLVAVLCLSRSSQRVVE